MFSILTITESITAELQDHLNHTCFRWKDSDSTTSYAETKPQVYAFTYDELSGTAPLHTPAILVQIISIDSTGLASYIVHVCVSYPSIQDKEITSKVEGHDNLYQYGNSDSITSAGTRSELYKAALLLGEQVYNILGKMSNTDFRIRNLSLQTPSPYMEQFPYCDCTVNFDVETVKESTESKLSTKVSQYL
jgi:hypothetical protein